MASSTARNVHGKRSSFQSEFTGNGASKRRNLHDETDRNVIGSEDTVYRYLCPVKKTGSIIGKGGEIAKQIRSETKSNMRINEALPGCEERVVTIYSTSDELNHFGDDGEIVCPALDALFKVHDMIVAEVNEEDDDDDLGDKQTVTVRMLVPSDQIGCVIGKGGQVIQNLRNETNAQIRVIKDNLPACALTLSHDELLQIIGEPLIVREALYQVASLLHDNPSRFQHSLLSSPSTLMHQPLISSHRNHAAARRDLADATEFCVCFICPAENVGGVIGKGGGFINQIRQETGATIRVTTSESEEDDSIIFISSKEFYEDQSPTVNAAILLQERCSEKVGKDTNDSTISTRLLVSSSNIGCLIGKGGAVISEMRSVTRANIRILQKENVPKIARQDEEMVQITGNPDAAMKALTQVILRLRANAFDMNHGLVLLPTSFPYISQVSGSSNKPKYARGDGSKDQDYSRLNLNSKRRNHVS
ncbi:hypothetical protein BRARA_F00947 [Brassica rapa]|uniref:K Homology domain-containing protein n=1 Tax=Brassica campestris TaxID=3711 RepID=A0A397YVU1_BRACM|nr:hypothetical protein BRARA_F00947 [Brassica rapa]CAG7868826.1 unnamed protein product [Brassica rapa]VDC65660.1 unnamed protein product [Brassica rapa]